MLTHTSEVVLTNGHLSKIKKLKEKHRAEDEKEREQMGLDHQRNSENGSHGTISVEDRKARFCPCDSSRSQNSFLIQCDENGSNASCSLKKEHEASGLSEMTEEKSAVIPIIRTFERRRKRSQSCLDVTLEKNMGSCLRSSENLEKFNGSCLDPSVSDCGNESFMAEDGALWDIFRREDSEKLKDYLRKHCREFRHLHCDPIQKVIRLCQTQFLCFTVVHLFLMIVIHDRHHHQQQQTVAALAFDDDDDHHHHRHHHQEKVFLLFMVSITVLKFIS